MPTTRWPALSRAAALASLVLLSALASSDLRGA